LNTLLQIKNRKVGFCSFILLELLNFSFNVFLYLSPIIIMASPLTLLNLQAQAAKIGVTIKEDEAAAYLEMLRVGSEAFNRLNSLLSYYLPVNTQTYL
jgi:hypothetical protein